MDNSSFSINIRVKLSFLLHAFGFLLIQIASLLVTIFYLVILHNNNATEKI